MYYGVQVWPGTTFVTEPQLHPFFEDLHSDTILVDTNCDLSSLEYLSQYIKNQPTKKIFFIDWYHTSPYFEENRIAAVQSIGPSVFFSLSPQTLPGVPTWHFDYLWNRTKTAFLRKISNWKQHSPNNYTQWPLNLEKRKFALMTLNRNGSAIKTHLRRCLGDIPGYHSDVARGIELDPDYPRGNGYHDWIAPPARRFLDDTYISAQVESRFFGDHVIFTEKTYDFLIQPRLVLNFGPRHFYRTLQRAGWKLYKHLSYDWDDIEDSPNHRIPASTGRDFGLPVGDRFQKYIETLRYLCSDLDRLHQIFIENQDTIAHNQAMLINKPFDTIELDTHCNFRRYRYCSESVDNTK